MDHVEGSTRRAVEKAFDRIADDALPLVIMRDKAPKGGYVSRNGKKEIKSRDITFLGLRQVEGTMHVFISASQMWTDEHFKKLDAANPGPIGTPKGEQMKMLIPLEEVLGFVRGVEKALEGWEDGKLSD